MGSIERQPNTQYCLSISYGKDSLACLGAIEELGLPLDRILHAEVWATQDIPADLPPMVEFKAKADKIIKDRWGIEVEHFYALNKDGTKKTYEDIFYRQVAPKRLAERERERDVSRGMYDIYGFPLNIGAWCNSKLKVEALSNAERSLGYLRFPNDERTMVQFGLENVSNKFSQKSESEVVSYIGIAIDEPERLSRLDGIKKVSPLALIGWTEANAMEWCIKNDLRSPLYDISDRGGCWFCHNQGIGQLRQLRHDYPNLWQLLLKWDTDSPITFKADGHTVHDFDRRFEAEDDGYIKLDEPFKWAMVDNIQTRWF